MQFASGAGVFLLGITGFRRSGASDRSGWAGTYAARFRTGTGGILCSSGGKRPNTIALAVIIGSLTALLLQDCQKTCICGKHKGGFGASRFNQHLQSGRHFVRSSFLHFYNSATGPLYCIPFRHVFDTLSSPIVGETLCVSGCLPNRGGGDSHRQRIAVGAGGLPQDEIVCPTERIQRIDQIHAR